MGVYIKDLKVPKNCDVCPIFLNFTTCGCERDHCMFQDVPEPHGDLIDRDAARGSIKPWSPEDEKNGCTFDTAKKLMHTMLDRAPTIIPAEGVTE